MCKSEQNPNRIQMHAIKVISIGSHWEIYSAVESRVEMDHNSPIWNIWKLVFFGLSMTRFLVTVEKFPKFTDTVALVRALRIFWKIAKSTSCTVSNSYGVLYIYIYIPKNICNRMVTILVYGKRELNTIMDRA